MSDSQLSNNNASLFETLGPELARRRRWRVVKDYIAKYSVGIGGVSVILTIVLIFFYLLYVVLPLFYSASTESVADYPVPANDPGANTRLLALEEQNEIAVRFTADARGVFFQATSGEIINDIALPLPKGVSVTSFARGNGPTDLVAYGLSDGRALLVKHKYTLSYPNDQRLITPSIVYPLGKDAIEVDDYGRPITQLAFRDDEEGTSLVALVGGNELILTHLAKEESLLEDEISFERTVTTIADNLKSVKFMLLDKEQRNLYLADAENNVSHYDISDKQAVELLYRIPVAKSNVRITAMTFLSGELSLLIGTSVGQISQWFVVKDHFNKQKLYQVRSFELGDSAITAIAQEQRRKGFVAADERGDFGFFHTTAERKLLIASVGKAVADIALSPRGNAMLIQDQSGNLHFWKIHNEHPEVSWSSLWSKVWYESYEEPQYVWQSSSASNDFEPKLSLTPLVFGTLKGAFYAMLFAVPLAILGAIYTAYFMAPKMRRMVKPSIETMEALPTVILGFLAGLWFAPYVEDNLPGIFSLLLIMPIGVLLFAYGWQCLPRRIRQLVPDGWFAAILVPVIILIAWFSLSMSHPLELWLFDGDTRRWLSVSMGIDFDQRNALVVGFAMGFAVIPTIFSIAEDAIFSVPKHLSFGSLALGATPWQTLVHVVLLTASPGIFSAVMIGLGRAVGETMIVLMATGNTPVMDFSVFQGMRTLAANIAVEVPESEVDSTHYRVLFLAALVLFLFTFLFNTLAEIVRQRLREKYSSL
ncbi:MAG: ABC transporter permease subunit [Gammaproteobacteria bacterium]|nr:ABC transporter permease subunit [Gammaproteobacteria bacterium]